MGKTAELDIKKIDFEKIINILKELRVQWSKLVQFFQMTSNFINVCLNKYVKKLTEQMEVAADRSFNGYHFSISLHRFDIFGTFEPLIKISKHYFFCSYTIMGLRKDMIYHLAFEAAKISHVVNMVSTSYVQVSQGHVMSRIIGRDHKIG